MLFKDFNAENVTVEQVISQMKAIRDIGAWCLDTKHKKAAEEIKAILFRYFPEAKYGKKGK